MADNFTLWVGGLSDRVTEDLLYELFLQAGPLDRVTIPKDREGRQKTFAFIQFRHEESVHYTIQLFEGIRLFGRYLRLQTRSAGPASSTPPQNSPSPYSSPQHPDPKMNYNRSMSGSNMNPNFQEQFKSPRDRNMGQTGFHRSASDPNFQDPNSGDLEKGSNSFSRSNSSADSFQPEPYRSPRDREQSSNYPRDRDSHSRSNFGSDGRHPKDSYHGSRDRNQGADNYSDRREQGRGSNDSSGRYQRSNTWHGGEKGNVAKADQSRSHHNHRQDTNPSSTGGQYNESIDVRRERVLQQQNLSLGMNRQGGRRDYDRMQPYQRSHSGSRRRY